jgi:phospholipid transport system substrate-binding protein
VSNRIPDCHSVHYAALHHDPEAYEMTRFPLITGLAWPMRKTGAGGLAMGKTLAAWIMMAGAVAAPAMGPRETVETAVGRVISLVQASEATKSESVAADRRTEIRKLARQLFDFEEVTRRTLSRHWAARSSDERAEFVALFTDLLERSYITRVEAYAGETVTYSGEAVEAGYATVRSKITDRRNDIMLDYRLHLREGRWRVYDLQIDGVSFVATYRSQFDRIIQAESYGALLERMRKKSFEANVAERGGKKL